MEGQCPEDAATPRVANDKPDDRLCTYVRELQSRLTDPHHARLLAVYQDKRTLEAMKEELGRILLEVAENDLADD